ncbi:MAG TPA: alpha/beta fold hydrolase [Blastocatellia bacterium]|jgi:pimeloyl-ACP methyl ester carboxylesterase|nr:alpha/beta fold hydrolase [Blastocatellia bacterium]
MNKRHVLTLIALALAFAPVCRAKQAEARQNTQTPTPNAATPGPNLEGAWEGALDLGATKLRLALNVTKAADGALAAKFGSLDQGAIDLTVDVISLKDGALHFEINRLQVVFDGTLNREGSEIAGQFKQGGGASFPLTLKRVVRQTTLNRPQEPKPPYPYDEEEVSYENKRDGVKLAGTLTLPRGKSSFPAVILITGSGAQNRNEELLGHKPFLVLADYLTRQGIAALRVDDRGVGGSTGSVPNSTSENFGADVLAGIEFLKSHKGVNPKQIGLIGHSEGGLIAPMVAAQSNDVAFIVMLAGPGLPGEEILHLQSELILKASGANAETMARQRASQEMVFTLLKQEKDNAVLEKKLREEFDKRIASASEAEKGKAKQAAEAQIKQALTPWFRYFLTYDPRPALDNVKCPVLALNGENDLQVPATENLREIEATLKAAGNKDVTIMRLPKLNHLFQTSKTGSPSEYGKIEETFAPSALNIIGDWILKHTAGQ